MDVKIKLGYLFFDLVLPIILGYLCRYQKQFDEVFFNRMMNLNVLCFIPLLAGLSCWTIQFNPDLFWLPLFGLILGIVPGMAAYFGLNKKFPDDLEKGSFLISAILSNFGTLGGLCAFIILGEIGYAYTQLAVLLQNAGLFLFCFPLANYYSQKSRVGASSTVDITKLFLNRNQIPVIGLFIGAGLNYFGIGRPEVMAHLFDPVVHLAAWTALIPVGYALDMKAVKLYLHRVIDLIPIKFIINPMVAFSLAFLLISDRQVINTILILSFTPTAINAVITAKIYSLNINIAMAAFVLTTSVFLLIIFPVMAYFMH